MLLVLLGALWTQPARADDLTELLTEGPLASVERSADGGLERIVAIVDTPTSPEAVWACITDFTSYPEWMPGAHKVTETRSEPAVVEHDWVLEVPGPNVRFSTRFLLNQPEWTITGTATSKNLAGSAWAWSLEPLPTGGTRVFRSSLSTGIADNWLLDMLGDHKVLLDLGINLASPVVEVGAVAEHCH